MPVVVGSSTLSALSFLQFLHQFMRARSLPLEECLNILRRRICMDNLFYGQLTAMLGLDFVM